MNYEGGKMWHPELPHGGGGIMNCFGCFVYYIINPLSEIEVVTLPSASHSYYGVQYFRGSKLCYHCQRLGIFNMSTDVDACDCTQGLNERCNSVRKYAVKFDSGTVGQNLLPLQGLSLIHI